MACPHDQAADATRAELVNTSIQLDSEVSGDSGPRLEISSAAVYRLLSAGPHGDVSGIRLGRFVVQRWIGAGGFGVVFLAHDHLLRRDVALKLPQPRVLARPEVRERCLREAEAAAQLYHPNVVPVFEAGEEEGVSYIASAYCPGPTLDAWLAEQGEPVPLQVVLSVGRQLAGAVEHAHSQKVLHRDIKPSNILLDPNPHVATGFTPKLTDFGLAKLADAGADMTGDHCLLGTPRYMAPEQAMGKAGAISPATDVYALGAVLYEMLTGVSPHAGDDYAQTLHQLLYSQPTPPRQLRPELPRDLQAILLKCLEKRPEDRYGSAAALAEDLRRFEEGRATTARPLGRLEGLRRWTTRQPAIASLLLLVGVAVVFLMGILVAYNRSLQDFNTHMRVAMGTIETHRSRLGGLLYVSKMQLAQQALEQDDVLQVSRLLTEIRTETPQLAGDFVWRHLWNRVESRSRELADVGLPIYELAFSPSGTHLAAGGADDVLRIFDGETLLAHSEISTGHGEINAAGFSPDGRLVATAGDDGTARIWEVQTGRSLVTVQACPQLAYGALFTPDGKQLITCGNEPVIRIWEVASGRLQKSLVGHTRAVEAIAISPDGTRLVSASSDETVRIWSLDAGESLRVLEGHVGRVVDVEYSPKGKYLLSGGVDQTVRLWRAADGEPVQTDRHLDVITSVAFLEDDCRWLAADRGGSVHVWRLRSEAELAGGAATAHDCWKAHEGRAWGVAVRKNREVVTAGADGKIQHWAAPSTARGLVEVGGPADINDMALDPTASRVYLLSVARGVETWDYASRQRVVARSLEPRPTRAICMLGNRVLVTADLDGTIEGREFPSQRLRFRFEADTGAAPEFLKWHIQLAASADSRRLAFMTHARQKVYVYDLVREQLIASFETENGPKVISLSPDGRRLAVDDADRVVIWDVDRQQRTAELKIPGNSIFAVEFSPSGDSLASSSSDRRIRVWDLWHPSRTPQMLDGHHAEAKTLSFSPDGQLLASGDERGEVKFWYLRERAELLTVKSAARIQKVAFSSDGNCLAQLAGGEVKLLDALAPQTGRDRPMAEGPAPAKTVAANP